MPLTMLVTIVGSIVADNCALLRKALLIHTTDIIFASAIIYACSGLLSQPSFSASVQYFVVFTARSATKAI